MYGLLAEKGYDKSSIGQIADIIGIKKASVYYYFRFKEEILVELTEYLYSLDDIFNEPSLEIQDKDSYREYLLNEGYSYIDYYTKNVTARRVYAEIDIQTNRIPQLKDFVVTYNERVKKKWEKILSYGVDIEAFTLDFSVNENTEFIFTVLNGIDDALLYDYAVDTKKVWKTTIINLLK